MKISNKQELQHIAFSRSSDIYLQGFMNLYNKCTAYSQAKVIFSY